MYVTSVYIISSVVIVFSNLTTIAAFRVSQALKGKKYYLVTSLAVADMMVGMVTIPCYVYMRSIQFKSGSMVLKNLYSFQEIIFPLVSVFHLAFLSFERYYAVSKPLKHRALGKKCFIYAVVMTWITGVTFALLGTFLPKFTLLFTVMPATIVALVVVVVCYRRIWVKFKRHQQEFNFPQRQDMRERRREVERNLAYTLLITTCLSLMTWLPFQVLVYVLGICNRTCSINLHGTVVTLIRLFHYSNSLVNFFVYSFRIPVFRKAIKRMCSCTGHQVVTLPRTPPSNQPSIIGSQSSKL